MTRRRTKYDKGAWEVQKERHRIAGKKPPPEDATQAVGEVIPAVMQGMGLANRLWEHSLAQEWPDLVGAQVAHHTRPGRLDRGMLVVFVSNSAWLNELSRYSQKRMLENLQARFGADKIRNLRLQLDPGESGPCPCRS